MAFNSPSSFNEDFANAIGVDPWETGQDDQQSNMVVDYLVGVLGGLDDGNATHVTHVVCPPSAPPPVPPISDFMAEVLSEIAKHEVNLPRDPTRKPAVYPSELLPLSSPSPLSTEGHGPPDVQDPGKIQGILLRHQ